MKLSKSKTLTLLNVLLIIVALIQFYLLSAVNVSSEKFFTTALEFDKTIKLIPAFIFPYFSVYILLILLFVRISLNKSGSELTSFLLTIILLWCSINFLHAFLHTQNTIRPEIKETSFFFELIKGFYESEKPYGTFPSWHAATAVLCAISFIKMNLGKKYPIIIWSFLIFISPIFLKMATVIDVISGAGLAFLCYSLITKISSVSISTEAVREIVKTFTLESLIQSVAIGIRDESTISSLIDGLTRIEKNLTEKDKAQIKLAGAALHPPVYFLKDVINKLINSINVELQIQKAKELYSGQDRSYTPTDKELKHAAEELINEACTPFDSSKFRFLLNEIKKRNTELINSYSIEEAAKERSKDVIFRFSSFIEAHKKDIPVLKTLISSSNGHGKLDFESLKKISYELRKPPYEISPDEIWNAYYRIDKTKVTPLGGQKNPANIIALAQYAAGKSERLEPFADKVNSKFQRWLKDNEGKGKIFSDEEMDWLKMMKNHVSSFLEINMTSFNNPPFVNHGGAEKAYSLFGHDLNRILYEFNEKLI